MFKKILSFLPQIIATLFLAGFVAYAWTEPSVTPPGGNVDAPINVSANPQTLANLKVLNIESGGTGSLLFNGLLNITRNLIVDGNVGIGTANPTAKLDVRGVVRLDGDIKVVKNGVECSVYSDCDNDSKTYFSGDCDESCSTCYSGSSISLVAPDGKDQDCNGKIDDSIVSAKVYPSPAYGYYIISYAGTIQELCQCFGGYNSGAWITAQQYSGSTQVSENYCGKTGARYNVIDAIGSCTPGDDGGAPWCTQVAQCWNQYIR